MSGSSALAGILARGLECLNLELTDAQCHQLLAHLELISKWNKVYNLTAVRDPQEMLTHHLLDSLAVVGPLHRHLGAAPREGLDPVHEADVLDVGSGAGLPGVTLAITGTHPLPLRVTCVDAVAKKAGFIRQVAAELGLKNLKAMHGRIEDLRLSPAEVITCRAFASLSDIVRLTTHHLSAGGVWMALKGQRPDEEIQALPAGIEVFHVEPIEVPFLDAQRCIVWMRPV